MRSSASKMFLFSTALALVFSFSNCKKDPSSFNELYKVEVEGMNVQRSSENSFVVFVDWTTEFVIPKLQIGWKATVEPASESPVNVGKSTVYTVTAEDGSKKKYTLDVCRVTWAANKFIDPNIVEINVFGQHKTNDWDAQVDDSKLTLFFEPRSEFRKIQKYGCRLILKLADNKIQTGVFPVNLTHPTQSKLDEAFGWFDWREGDASHSSGVFGGYLEITNYDAEKRLISGKFRNMKHYEKINQPYPCTFLSGDFVNLPVRF